MRSVGVIARVVAAVGLVAALACGTEEKPEGWTRFASPAGGYEVLLPSPPEELVQPFETRFGRLTRHVAMVALEDTERGYMIIWGDYPEDLVQRSGTKEFLDDLRDGVAASFDGRVLDERDASLEEHPGRLVRLESETGEAIVTARIWLVGSRAYQVLAVTEPGEESGVEVARFLDSFRLRR